MKSQLPEEESLAGKFFQNVDHDPYKRFAARLFKIPESRVWALTRFKTKIHLFFIDVNGSDLDEHAKALWDHYWSFLIPLFKVENQFRDKDHFFEHFLFMTEDVFNEYPGWYDFIGEYYDKIK